MNIRVIAATNRDPRRAMAEGQFREDPFCWINVISFTLPDLCDRRGDISLLAWHLLEQECPRIGRSRYGSPPRRWISIQSYGWPGNVREPRSALELVAALARAAGVRPHQLPPEIRAADPIGGAAWWRGETFLSDLERQGILHALNQTCGDRAAAARLLRASERSLFRRLDRHKLRDLPSA